MTLVLYILSGLLGVSNMILWGVYGDLLMEQFEWKKLFRSLALGVAYSLFLYQLNPDLPLIMVALNVITFERVTTEIYKALIRKEKQGKYLIPSDLNLKFSNPLKKLLGLFLIGLVLTVYAFINFEVNKLLLLLLIGFVPALGGMLKDAPYEGFDGLKFFRSPGVSLAIGLPILFFFPHLSLPSFLFAVWGGERIVSECYKKIIKGNAPGKFKVDEQHPVQISWKKKRKYLIAPYWGSILLILLLAIISY